QGRALLRLAAEALELAPGDLVAPEEEAAGDGDVVGVVAGQAHGIDHGALPAEAERTGRNPHELRVVAGPQVHAALLAEQEPRRERQRGALVGRELAVPGG